MEQEYKWCASPELRTALIKMLSQHEATVSAYTLQMAAVYYEMPDGFLRKNGLALRLRRENDVTVCCMKRTVLKEGALAVREEYETEASDLKDGLCRLPEHGAPRDLCIFLQAQEFCELARTEFTRQCFLLDLGTFTAEFAADEGRLGKTGKMQPFAEFELELKSGSEEAFAAFAEGLQAQYGLTPQPLSKLARAANI